MSSVTMTNQYGFLRIQSKYNQIFHCLISRSTYVERTEMWQ